MKPRELTKLERQLKQIEFKGQIRNFDSEYTTE